MMLAFILNNQYVRTVAAVSLVLIIGLPVAYYKGASTEQLKQAKAQVILEQKYKADLAAQYKEREKLAVQYHAEQSKSAVETAKLKEIIKHDKNLIDRINHIDFSFVQHVSKPTGLHTTSTATSRANTETRTIPNARAVPAHRVADYIVDLGAHDESCVIQLNSLIEHEASQY